MNIEARLNITRGDEYTREAVKLLGESSSELLKECANALESVLAWLERNNTERFKKFEFTWFSSTPSTGSKGSDVTASDAEKGNHTLELEKPPASVADAMKLLQEVLERFKSNDR